MKSRIAMLAAAAFGAAVLVQGQVALADPPHCPPGHARKGWCTPGDRGGAHHRRYRAGDHVGRDDYVVIDDWRDRGWQRPPDGGAYVRIDDNVYQLLLGTGLILEALGY